MHCLCQACCRSEFPVCEQHANKFGLAVCISSLVVIWILLAAYPISLNYPTIAGQIAMTEFTSLISAFLGAFTAVFICVKYEEHSF